MALVLEILFVIFGLIALFTGSLPSWLFGGGNYEIKGTPIRLLGAILPIPLIVGLCGVSMMRRPSDVGGVLLFEIVSLVIVAVIGLITVYNVRQLKAPVVSEVYALNAVAEEEINQKSKSALIMALIAMIGFPAIVFAPWSTIRAWNTLNLIKQTPSAERFRTKTIIALMLGIIALLLWVIGPVIVFLGFSNGWFL